MTPPRFTSEHRELLAAAAIDEDVAVEAGVRSVVTPADLPEVFASWRSRPGITPGIVFPATGPDGRTFDQYRPDRAVELDDGDRTLKYIGETGKPPVVAVHPRKAALVSGDVTPSTILVVEGTKQHLAAVSAADPEVLTVGITGSNNWGTGGVPLDDWNHLPIDDADVVIAFDADIATNRNVHDAGEKLAQHLELLGAASVRFLKAPSGAKAGLDDYLASFAPDARRRALAKMIKRAGDLPKKPAKKRTQKAEDDPAARFFDTHGLRAVDLLAAVREGRHHALGPDGSVWTYSDEDGLYVDDEHALVAAVRDQLGNRYRGLHQRTVVELLGAALSDERRRLPAEPIGRVVVTPTGALDVATLELHPHDPNRMAFAGLAVGWDPGATCPTFDRWLAEMCGSQAEDLLEALGLVLVPWCGQRKVPFLIGPSRSAKGTVLRLLEAIIGDRYRSAVTLHELSSSRFATANLFGKVLNSAGDLSDHHIDDLAMFKMLTGDDSVSAERKFRDSFVFRNTALFVFSANQPPTVSENSRAYLTRVRPYLFPHSFEGREDPTIEAAMMGELPGILVRLVEGARRWLDRGGYAPINPAVEELFGRQSDPVAMFVAQVLEPTDGEFVTTSDLHDAYRTWASANGRGTLGRNKLLARADNTLGDRTRERSGGRGPQGWRGWRVLPESEWIYDDATYALVASWIEPTGAGSAASSPTSPHEGEVKKGESDVVVPREGEIGQKPALPAPDPEPPTETPGAPIRDDHGRVLF